MPTHLLLAESTRYVFNCSIRGYPVPDIKWYRNGALVERNDHITPLSNGSLMFDPVLRKDVAMYACLGSNILGSVATLATNLTVACEYYSETRLS